MTTAASRSGVSLLQRRNSNVLEPTLAPPETAGVSQGYPQRPSFTETTAQQADLDRSPPSSSSPSLALCLQDLSTENEALSAENEDLHHQIKDLRAEKEAILTDSRSLRTNIQAMLDSLQTVNSRLQHRDVQHRRDVERIAQMSRMMEQLRLETERAVGSGQTLAWRQ